MTSSYWFFSAFSCTTVIALSISHYLFLFTFYLILNKKRLFALLLHPFLDSDFKCYTFVMIHFHWSSLLSKNRPFSSFMTLSSSADCIQTSQSKGAPGQPPKAQLPALIGNRSASRTFSLCSILLLFWWQRECLSIPRQHVRCQLPTADLSLPNTIWKSVLKRWNEHFSSSLFCLPQHSVYA